MFFVIWNYTNVWLHGGRESAIYVVFFFLTIRANGWMHRIESKRMNAFMRNNVLLLVLIGGGHRITETEGSRSSWIAQRNVLMCLWWCFHVHMFYLGRICIQVFMCKIRSPAKKNQQSIQNIMQHNGTTFTFHRKPDVFGQYCSSTNHSQKKMQITFPNA